MNWKTHHFFWVVRTLGWIWHIWPNFVSVFKPPFWDLSCKMLWISKPCFFFELILSSFVDHQIVDCLFQMAWNHANQGSFGLYGPGFWYGHTYQNDEIASGMPLLCCGTDFGVLNFETWKYIWAVLNQLFRQKTMSWAFALSKALKQFKASQC